MPTKLTKTSVPGLRWPATYQCISLENGQFEVEIEWTENLKDGGEHTSTTKLPGAYATQAQASVVGVEKLMEMINHNQIDFSAVSPYTDFD
jgi:hypothetical protein